MLQRCSFFAAVLFLFCFASRRCQLLQSCACLLFTALQLESSFCLDASLLEIKTLILLVLCRT